MDAAPQDAWSERASSWWETPPRPPWRRRLELVGAWAETAVRWACVRVVVGIVDVGMMITGVVPPAPEPAGDGGPAAGALGAAGAAGPAGSPGAAGGAGAARSARAVRSDEGRALLHAPPPLHPERLPPVCELSRDEVLWSAELEERR